MAPRAMAPRPRACSRGGSSQAVDKSVSKAVKIERKFNKSRAGARPKCARTRARARTRPQAGIRLGPASVDPRARVRSA